MKAKLYATMTIVMGLIAASYYYQSYRLKINAKLELARAEARLATRVDSLARQTAANERAFLTILARIETKGWEPICVDGLLAAYDYERQRIINQPENERK